MTYKQLFYFTGHCLALDEHPHFRKQIIELFADDALSLSKDANRNPSVPERVLPEQPRNPSVPERVLPEQPRNPSVPEREAVEGKIQKFIQLCSDHLIIPAIYLKLKAHDILADLPAILNPSVPERMFPEQRSVSKATANATCKYSGKLTTLPQY